MAKAIRQGAARGGNDGGEGPERHHEHEHEREHRPWDDAKEHMKIEKRRFAGGLPATPERYALARAQWYKLPGAILRPSMDPPSAGLAAAEPPPHPAGQGGEPEQ